MNAPPTLTELKLSPEMKQAINTAMESGRAIAISYVDEEGAPQLSYRGSTQAYGDKQLAIWVRNPEGRILPSIGKNAAVALIYGNFDPTARGFMIFRGRARVDSGAEARRRVYEGSPEYERNQDKDRKGVALIIDLTSVEGFFGGARLKMRA
ncbi:MAG TPA: pyridoxamine 5'-phosphate oxidase family protein [Gammaproteobacteria bacterium]|nr:pyridoxamine 5'-phosphate oxidase family protein [Gammaproteobacteria bacterium]